MPQGSTSYGAKDMQVLEGLDPVRKRPGMYIGSTGPTGLHHCVWEVVDNSVDEAMAGYCDRIDITLLADGGCRVVDNGRGIPTDINPQHKISGVEIALTKLHGGGKFGGDGYKVSGGLHGVGVSVVNALSRKLVVEVDRDGKRHTMTFADGGKPQGKLKVTGDAPRNGRSGPRHGTTVTFWPDGTIFETVEFSARTILERLQMMAFLNKGLEIRFRDERPDHDTEPIVFKYAGGIVDFVKHVNKTKESLFAQGRLLWPTRTRPPRSRSRSSGTRATTPTASTASPTASTPSRAAPTSRASRRRSPRRSTSTPGPRTSSRRRTPTSRAKTSARASPPSSRCACATPSSRARPRPSSATPP